MDQPCVRRAAAGGRAGGVRLRGRARGRAAFPCHRDRRVLDLQVTPGKPALTYWQGQYIPLDDNEDISHPADLGLPTMRALWQV